MSLADKVAGAAVWQFSAVVTQGLLHIATIAAFARWLSPTDFGLMAIANMTLVFTTLLTEMGVGAALIQRRNLTPAHVGTAFALSLFLGAIGSSAIWAAAPLLGHYFKNDLAVPVIRVAGLSALFGSFTSAAGALLEKDLRYRELALVNFVSYVLGYCVIGLALGWLGFGVWAMVSAALGQLIFRILILYAKVVRSFRFTFGWGQARDLTSFGAGVSIAGIFNYLSYNGDNFIVGRWLGTSTLGLYQMAFQVMDLPRRLVGSAIDKVIFSVFASVQDDQAKVREVYLQTLAIVKLLFVPITIVMVTLTPELVRIFLGPKWETIIAPLRILLLQIPLRGTIRLTDSVVSAVGQISKLAQCKMIYAITIIGAALIGLKWGMIGVVTAVTVAVFFNWIIMLRLALACTGTNIWNYFVAWKPGVLVGLSIFATIKASSLLVQNLTDNDLIVAIVAGITALTLPMSVFLLKPAWLGDGGVYLWKQLMRKRIARKSL